MMFAMPHAGAKWAIDPEYWYLHEIQLIPTWAQTHCFGRALEYLESGKVQVKDLVTHEMPLVDYDKGIALAAKGGPGTLKVILHPNVEEYIFIPRAAVVRVIHDGDLLTDFVRLLS